MNFKHIKSKLFKTYVQNVYGKLYKFQFDKKIIYYGGDDEYDTSQWALYYDIEQSSIYIFGEEKFYSIDSFMEKINKLKVFL